MSSGAAQALAVVIGAGLLAGALGCRKQPAAAASAGAERTELVAQACPELEARAEPVSAKDARFFVELVELSSRELPSPLGRWLEEHPVRLRSTANAIAFPDVPSSTPWGQCVDAVCASQRTLTVTAQAPALGTDPIPLRVHIEEPAPQGSAAAPRVLLDTALQVRAQEPALLPSPPELTQGSLLVTVYLLLQHDDLQRILTCQARRSERQQQLR